MNLVWLSVSWKTLSSAVCKAVVFAEDFEDIMGVREACCFGWFGREYFRSE